MDRTKHQIYLAGPLFSASQRIWNATIAEALQGFGWNVYLPQRDTDPSGGETKIFKHNVVAIDKAEVVVACLDEIDPDSGTAWEMGYSFARTKHVLWYRTDTRSGATEIETTPVNLMLGQSGRQIPKPEGTLGYDATAEQWAEQIDSCIAKSIKGEKT